MKRTEAEIEEQLRLVKAFRAVVPRHSVFGDDNHLKSDQRIKVLESVLKNPFGVAARREALLDSLTDAEMGQNGALEAYDWLLGDIDDPLITQSDVDIFTEKRGK